MRRIRSVLVIALALLTDATGAQEITTITSDCYTQPQIKRTVNGKPQEPGIDLLCVDMPEILAEQVEKFTGIIAKKDSISMIVVDIGKGRWMHSVSGDGFSAKGSGEIPFLGIKPWQHDFAKSYLSLVESVSDNQLYAYGYFDYHDRLNEKRCFIAVELTGKIIIQEGKKPTLQGTATWTGPLQNLRSPAMEKSKQDDRGTKR
jgi:hypothetical protein